MSEHTAVLFANEAFYIAFSGRDLSAMDDAWSRTAPVSCVHPGWHILLDREDVLESWEGILSNPESPVVECHHAHATIHGDTAVVVCIEAVGDVALVATNIFVREGRTWKIVHHQAGPGLPPLSEEFEEEPETLQ